MKQSQAESEKVLIEQWDRQYSQAEHRISLLSEQVATMKEFNAVQRENNQNDLIAIEKQIDAFKESFEANLNNSDKNRSIILATQKSSARIEKIRLFVDAARLLRAQALNFNDTRCVIIDDGIRRTENSTSYDVPQLDCSPKDRARNDLRKSLAQYQHADTAAAPYLKSPAERTISREITELLNIPEIEWVVEQNQYYSILNAGIAEHDKDFQGKPLTRVPISGKNVFERTCRKLLDTL